MGKRHILVLDDSEIVLEALAPALEQAGFAVSKARSMLEFDQILTMSHPDAVLCDVNLPVVKGDAICRNIKSRLSSQATPVLLFSDETEERLEAMARSAGADGYVCKSAGVDGIVARVSQLLGDP